MRELADAWRTPFTFVLISVLVSGLVTACSSDDKSRGFGGFQSQTNALDGRFVDADVEGLEYLTYNSDLQDVHLSGVTSATGTYQYENGESILFSIGSIVVGATGAKAVITPADLVPTNLITETQARQDYLSNLIRLLQTLDVDGDPNNGISIPEAASSVAPLSDIDFAVSPGDFEANLDTLTYIGLVTNVSSLVDAAAAEAHFEQSVAALVEEGYEDPRASW